MIKIGSEVEICVCVRKRERKKGRGQSTEEKGEKRRRNEKQRKTEPRDKEERGQIRKMIRLVHKLEQIRTGKLNCQKQLYNAPSTTVVSSGLAGFSTPELSR